MADDKYDDEYEFGDLDALEPESASDETNLSPEQGEKKNIRRNALIVVACVVLAMLAYKFLGSFLASETQPQEASVPSISSISPQDNVPATPQPIVTPAPTPVPIPTPAPLPSVDNSQITQKLSALEMGQQTLRSEVVAVNSQLGGINSNVNELSEKITELSQMLSNLASRVEQQSGELAALNERTKPKPIQKVVIRRPTIPRRVYHVQAVIPGRAWLIATNGSTLTVREGTQIPGYGVVKLIDAMQGRVLMSSGQVIRFSQQDS